MVTKTHPYLLRVSSDPQAQVTKKLVYSGSSNARQLQSYIESNIYHRQGMPWSEEGDGGEWRKGESEEEWVIRIDQRE